MFEFAEGKRGEQKSDPDTGLLVWEVTVLDNDPDAKGASKAVKVKILAPFQPVPPPELVGLPAGMSLRPVEFEHLTVKPYCTEVMKGRFKVAYSLTARGMAAPAGSAGTSNGHSAKPTKNDPVSV